MQAALARHTCFAVRAARISSTRASVLNVATKSSICRAQEAGGARVGALSSK